MPNRYSEHTPSGWADTAPGSEPRRAGCFGVALFRAALVVGFVSAAVVGLAAVGTVLGGLGTLLARFLPLTAFQLAALMLAAGIATGFLFFLQDIRDLLREALAEEDEDDELEDREPAPKPYLHPVLPFDRDELLKASGLCPCGSGLRYEDCCGNDKHRHRG